MIHNFWKRIETKIKNQKFIITKVWSKILEGLKVKFYIFKKLKLYLTLYSSIIFTRFIFISPIKYSSYYYIYIYTLRSSYHKNIIHIIHKKYQTLDKIILLIFFFALTTSLIWFEGQLLHQVVSAFSDHSCRDILLIFIFILVFISIKFSISINLFIHCISTPQIICCIINKIILVHNSKKIRSIL
jgi:hypothetical protein